MCGIASIIGKNKNLNSDLKKSLSKIKHRGHSYFEMKTFDNAALGANRLAIVDRGFGKQPLGNEKDTIFAVQNGEIFNYKELKDQLVKKGHKFKTDCDTEILVHLWEEFGVKMVNKIDSEMFAFVIYDDKKKEYFIARDPMGVKPLYYAYDNQGALYVGSEIKQLSQFKQIKQIKEFPSGHYLYKDKFVKYFNIKTGNKFSNKTEVRKKVKKLLEEAVKKRVQTDLPIGVFLSGGVDSTLVMELASKYHHNVTGIILGTPGSSDFENAVRFCKERNYPYHVIYPNPDYEKEVEDLIYYLESYEPLIVRHSFANDIISKAATELGLKIVLVGEGADELFAGYNEFSHLSEEKINQGCEMLLQSLAKGHLMRVDKTSMRYTIEVRSPFFDTELVKYGLNIDGKLKIERKDHRMTVKSILRDVAATYLPDYIAYRFKAPFANGAGMDIGFNYKSNDGILAKIAHQNITDREFKIIKKKYPEYNFSTKEEVFYFKFYKKFGYDKFKEDKYRLVVKDNLRDLEDKEDSTKLLVGEFDKLALYFPVYLASKLGLFDKYGLNVDFIATGGDDKTYASLIQNSAQIGLADPMFAMIDNPFAIKGEIIGELVNKPPIYAVTFKPQIKIKQLEDLEKYKVGSYEHWHIGTYEQFSTTNTITRYLLNRAQVSAVNHSEIEQKLYNGDIDVALVLAEQAFNLEKRGARIIYNVSKDIPHFLFTGLTIAETLEDRHRKLLPKFLQAIQDSLRYIHKDKKESLKLFKKEFKNLKQADKTFKDYSTVWVDNLKVKKGDWDQSLHFWRTTYPHLLQDINPFFLEKRKEDLIFEELTRTKYKRHRPYKEFEMRELIREYVKENASIPLVGFWGASDKASIDFSDELSIQNFEILNNEIKKIYKSGLQLTAILADEHAKHNGYPKKEYDNYLKQIKNILENRGWSCIYLSELWKKNRLNENVINQKIKTYPKNWWAKVKIKDKLLSQASKHSHLRNKTEGAKFYYMMRKEEAAILGKLFSKSIYWAYSDGAFQEIYPDLPSLYFYTTKKKINIPPWFMSIK